MVYLYKKTVGNKSYYYLRASERKGKRTIVKDIAYLGSSLDEVKKNLEKLPKYKEQIRKTYRTLQLFFESNRFLEKAKLLKSKKDPFLDPKLMEVEACKLHYQQVFQKTDPKTREEVFKQFIIDFAFNTTSIEGNTINLAEARSLLEEGRTPKNKTLREIYDLQNTEKVMVNLLQSKQALSHECIMNIHTQLMENIDPRKGYRTTDGRVLRSNFDATPALYVKADMNLLLKWYQEHERKLHPFVLAVLFHHKFERI